MAKARVVHIITKLELGGAQEITLFQVKNLPRNKYDVTLITGVEGLLTPEARSIPDMDFIELPELVREVSPARDLAAGMKLRRIISDYVRRTPGGVLVHTHSSKAGIVGRVAAKMAGARSIVHSIHGFGFNDTQPWPVKGAFIGIERAVSMFTDGFTADSQDNIDRGRRLGIINGVPSVVVRCAIPVGFFADGSGADRDSLGIPPDAPVVTMVSCLKPQKAPVDFVRVAARVLKEVPSAVFLHAGDGELKGDVLAEAGRLGISGSFRLLGWRRDVREIIHASDVVVLTSLWEGLPRVFPQAMAAGKPIVATAVDGTPEAVKDGVNGFLAQPHDVEHMADRVALLLKDRPLAARMGEAGRSMVREFDEAESLARVEALYDTLLKEAL